MMEGLARCDSGEMFVKVVKAPISDVGSDTMNDSFWERHRFKFYTIGMVVCGFLIAMFS